MVNHNSQLAGYGSGSTSPTTSATTTFSVPGLSCTSTTDGQVFAFINMTTSPGEDGSDRYVDGGGVAIECSGGIAEYSAFTEINDVLTYRSLSISSGDKVRVTLSASVTRALVRVADLTTPGKVKASISGPEVHWPFSGGVLVGDAAHLTAVNLPIPSFGKLTFTDTTINGESLGSTAPAEFEIYTGSTLEVATGSLDTAGKRFSTTFKSS